MENLHSITIPYNIVNEDGLYETIEKNFVAKPKTIELLVSLNQLAKSANESRAFKRLEYIEDMRISEDDIEFCFDDLDVPKEFIESLDKPTISEAVFNLSKNKTQIASILGMAVNTFNAKEEEWTKAGIIPNRIPYVFKAKRKITYTPEHINSIIDVIYEELLEKEKNGGRISRKERSIFLDRPALKYRGQPCHVINVQNQKGGTGKSLSLINIAMAMAQNLTYRPRICIIDLDPQGSLGGHAKPKEYQQDDLDALSAVDIMLNKFEETLYHSFKKYGLSHREIIEEAILDTNHYLVKTIPAFPIDELFSEKAYKNWDKKLSFVQSLKTEIIDHIRDDFDIILIDTGPQINALTNAALFASNGMFVPVTPKSVDYDSTQQFLLNIFNRVVDLEDTIDGEVRSEGLEWLKIGVVNYDHTDEKKSRSDSLIKEQIESEFKEFVLPHQIYRDTSFDVAQRKGRTVIDLKTADGVSPEGLKRAQKSINDVANDLFKVITNYDQGL